MEGISVIEDAILHQLYFTTCPHPHLIIYMGHFLTVKELSAHDGVLIGIIKGVSCLEKHSE